jgi:hypothetical protein
VLGNLEALGLLTQRGTVSGTVLADNADLCKVRISSYSDSRKSRKLDVLVVRLAIVLTNVGGVCASVCWVVV